MQTHTKIALSLLLLGVTGIVAYRFVAPYIEDSQQLSTSDARDTKGKIHIGMDSWIGYFPLCSQEMRKRMRTAGYLLSCEDDKADYRKRMAELEEGDLEFAVTTVDAYLLSGSATNFPGTIVAVIDESKGGDAIVAWGDRLKSLDALKAETDYRIAFTPASPSAHLLKSMAVHFDIPRLLAKDKGWHLATDGSEQALKKLLDKEVDAAVLWEPDVSRALQNQGLVKLLGTEDTDKLIVDVLLVSRKFSQKNPQAVATVLENYFDTLRFYRNSAEALLTDAAAQSGLDQQRVGSMLQGVRWASLSDNAQNWFGIGNQGAQVEQGLVEAIETATDILIEYGDYSRNPLPDEDPFRLIYSQYVGDLYDKALRSTQFGQSRVDTAADKDQGLARKFSALSAQQWQALKEIGTLKIRPIVFQSGTDDLSYEGKLELDKAVRNLSHYPNFRVMIKGHTGLRGNKEANRKLSAARADAVARYLKVTYNVDGNRIRTLGKGAAEPLPRKMNESSRAYNYRLPRVELFLVTDDI